MYGPDADREPSDDPSLRSRTDARKERLEAETALFELAEALVALNDRALEKLGLPEEIVEAVQGARRLRRGAQTRALRLVRAALRDADVDAIRKGLARVR
jgi:ribosomal 50S subunit-associated protein YjgA (DUF615 family)